MKVQGRKNLSGFPRPDAISNHFLYSVQTLAIKSKKHPEIRDRYLRIKKRRGHKKAIIRYCKNASYSIIPHAQKWREL